MAESFLGEIRMFAGNFAPRSWALCDGQLLSINQNDALFSLLGTTYGGDGRTTFGLPDLRGRVPIHQGTGPGLSLRRIGEKSGSENATVSQSQLPSHTHPMKASSALASFRPPGVEYAQAGEVVLLRQVDPNPESHVPGTSTSMDLYFNDTPDTPLSPEAVSTAAGGGQGHFNIMPFQVVNFIISLVGIFPSRN
jgi:microcystin-dependent protein